MSNTLQSHVEALERRVNELKGRYVKRISILWS